MTNKLIYLLLTMTLFSSNAYGYKEKIHDKATEFAVNLSSAQLYMTKYLGYDSSDTFSNGLFTKQTFDSWVRYGGVAEDNLPRFLNHFFDPTTEKGIYLYSENLSPYGHYSNPSSLKNSIIKANGGVSNYQLWLIH